MAVTMPVRLFTVCPSSGERKAGPWMSVTVTEETTEKQAANRKDESMAVDCTVKFTNGHERSASDDSIFIAAA